jgi:hypothetical protein
MRVRMSSSGDRTELRKFRALLEMVGHGEEE